MAEPHVPESEKVAEKVAPPPPPEVRYAAAPQPPQPGDRRFVLGDVVLRFLVFASALAAVLVMVTSKQTKLVPTPFPPFQLVSRDAKFTHSPAFIYFVAALSVAGFYSIITFLISLYAHIIKPGCCSRVVSHFVIFDVLLLGIVASATGTAGGVAYIGLKGNSHVQWQKICNLYKDFCRHIGASIAVSLFGSVVLALLVLLSIYGLSKKIPK